MIKNQKSYLSYILFPLVFLAAYLAIKLNYINSYWGTLFLLGSVHGIVAMSLNLINGLTGQSCLGQAGFMSIGAYVSAMCTKLVFKDSMTDIFSKYGLFFMALILGGIMAALMGLLIGIPSLRLKGDYLAIITLGFSEIIRVLWRVTPAAGRAMGLSAISKLTTLPIVFLVIVLVMLLFRNFKDSRYGRACIAVRENELAGDAMGIDTTKAKIIAFVLSAFVAGVGGGLYAHMMTFINPDTFNQLKSTDIILYVYAGGVGSFSNSLLGAIIFTFLPEALRFLGEWRLVIYALALVLIMVNRPKGIFGGREFGFMRFGQPESIHQKADNDGILAMALRALKEKGKNRKPNAAASDNS